MATGKWLLPKVTAFGRLLFDPGISLSNKIGGTYPTKVGAFALGTHIFKL